jgi:hypothetical protein
MSGMGSIAGRRVARAERQVLALAERLRLALDRDARDEQMEVIRAMFGIHKSSSVISAFRAWLAAQSRYRDSEPGAPDHEWLRREMDRMCEAYEAAVGEQHGP